MKQRFFFVLMLVLATCVAAQAFDGLKFGENGRLVPSAFDKVKTFETDKDGNVKQPATIYYVSPTGNDSNNGTSIETAFRTVVRTRLLLEPGVAVRILPGVYEGMIYLENRKGTEENPIWIGGYDPSGEGKRPLLVNPGGVVISYNCSYMVFHDMEVTTKPEGGTYNANAQAFNVFSTGTGESKYFVFRGLYVHHVPFCVFKFAGTDFFYLFDCEIAHGVLDGVGWGAGSINSVGCHNSVVAYNYLHTGEGIGVLFKGGSANNDIHNNLFVNHGSTAVTMGQDTGPTLYRPPLTTNRSTYEAQNIRAYSNLIIGGLSAFQIYSSRGCYFVNNTVIQPQRFVFRILSSGDGNKLANFGAPHYNVIANNIFCYEALAGEQLNIAADVKPADKKNIIISNNIFFSAAHAQGNMAEGITEFGGEKNLFVDPQFTNPANPPLTEEELKATRPSVIMANFALKAGSPAAGAGANTIFVKEDFNGRPFANPRSIGAMEK